MDGQVGAWASAFVIAICAGAPALAAGEGSRTDNPALLHDPDGVCTTCAGLPTAEPTDPWLDIDWSLGLRGALTSDSAGQRYEIILAPEASLSHQSLRGGYEFGGAAELSVTPEGNARIGSIELTGEGSYAMDAVTTASANAALTVTQDDPDGPDQPANLKATPLVVGAQVQAEVTREFGLAELGLRGGLERSMTGETSYDDGSTDDNSYLDNTVATIGGRLGWRITPWFVAWLDGEAAVQMFDQLSPSLSVRLDNTTYTGRAGVTVAMRDTLSFEASTGLSWRDYVDASIDDFYAVLYAASLSYAPNEALAIDAELSTTLSSPEAGSAGTASLVYAATASARTQVNPWIRARASAGANFTQPVGAGDEERSWTAGAGLDWLLDRNTDLNADYTFAQSQSAADPAEDTHTVSVGVTWHR